MSQTPEGEAVHDALTLPAAEPARSQVAAPDRLLRRVHGLVGLCVLGGYCALHVIQGYAVFIDREVWVDRVTLFSLANAATTLCLAGLGAHVLTAVLLARSSDDPTADIEPAGALGLRRLQQVSGGVLLVFLLVHVVHLWPLTRHDPVLAREGYVALSDWLETPFGLCVYVAATTALAFHLAHGAARVVATFGFVSTPFGLKLTRYVVGTLGVIAWCATLHWLGHFANGVGLWPITGEDDPLPQEATSTEGAP